MGNPNTEATKRRRKRNEVAEATGYWMSEHALDRYYERRVRLSDLLRLLQSDRGWRNTGDRMRNYHKHQNLGVVIAPKERVIVTVYRKAPPMTKTFHGMVERISLGKPGNQCAFRLAPQDADAEHLRGKDGLASGITEPVIGTLKCKHSSIDGLAVELTVKVNIAKGTVTPVFKWNGDSEKVLMELHASREASDEWTFTETEER